MSWRYGLIVEYLPNYGNWYSVHEIYHDKQGRISWTQNPITVDGDSRKDVIETLEMMLADVKAHRAFRPPTPPVSKGKDND